MPSDAIQATAGPANQEDANAPGEANAPLGRLTPPWKSAAENPGPTGAGTFRQPAGIGVGKGVVLVPAGPLGKGIQQATDAVKAKTAS